MRARHHTPRRHARTSPCARAITRTPFARASRSPSQTPSRAYHSALAITHIATTSAARTGANRSERSGGEARRVRFELDAERVDEVRDGSVLASERDELDDLIAAMRAREARPQGVVDRCAFVERFAHVEEDVLGGLECVAGAGDGGGDLGFREIGSGSEERDVHAPLVLGPAEGGGAQDDDLAFAERDGAGIEEATDAHAAQHARVVRERSKEGDRRDAGRHQLVEVLLYAGIEWGGQWSEACCHATEFVARRTGLCYEMCSGRIRKRWFADRNRV